MVPFKGWILPEQDTPDGAAGPTCVRRSRRSTRSASFSSGASSAKHDDGNRGEHQSQARQANPGRASEWQDSHRLSSRPSLSCLRCSPRHHPRPSASGAQPPRCRLPSKRGEPIFHLCGWQSYRFFSLLAPRWLNNRALTLSLHHRARLLAGQSSASGERVSWARS